MRSTALSGKCNPATPAIGDAFNTPRPVWLFGVGAQIIIGISVDDGPALLHSGRVDILDKDNAYLDCGTAGKFGIPHEAVATLAPGEAS